MKTIKILIISILVLSLNLFASGVATITALKGSANIQRGDSTINAAIGTELEQKDVLKTKDNSKLQIIFKDETIITLGKNSDFSIEEYMFEENQKPIAKFGMIKGAMRTITGRIGKIAPEKFSVQTKTATIGIRGTNFAVTVGEDGSYQAYCTYGAISVTINGEVHIVKQGFFISISPTGKVEIKEFTPNDLKDMQKKNFNGDDKKTGDANKGENIGVSQDEENNEQLDVTVNDYSDIIITDATDTTIISSQETASLSALLSSYSMNNAAYTGTITVSLSETLGLSTGDQATLAIDFGADTANLSIDGGALEFYHHPTFSGDTFNVGTGANHTASGTFQSPTGNTVIGNYYHYDGMYTESGGFNVTSPQVLH